MLLPALFGVSLRSWRSWHERIQALGLVPLLPQRGEQAEAPSLRFPLRGYQKLRTRQELTEAGCQQGCSHPGMCRRCLRQDTELRKLRDP